MANFNQFETACPHFYMEQSSKFTQEMTGFDLGILRFQVDRHNRYATNPFQGIIKRRLNGNSTGTVYLYFLGVSHILMRHQRKGKAPTPGLEQNFGALVFSYRHFSFCARTQLASNTSFNYLKMPYVLFVYKNFFRNSSICAKCNKYFHS